MFRREQKTAANTIVGYLDQNAIRASERTYEFIHVCLGCVPYTKTKQGQQAKKHQQSGNDTPARRQQPPAPVSSLSPRKKKECVRAEETAPQLHDEP